jgi:HSP20 family protein
MKKSGKKKKAGQKERMRNLDEKTKESEETKNGEGSEGVAEGVLKGVGQMIPGLSGLIKGLEKSPAFKERLKKVNQEIERKLKEAPLKRTGDRGPHIESSFSARALVQEEKPSFGRKVKKTPVPPPPEPKEPVVDVFDEKDHLRIIAELPGVAEREIKTNLEKDTLSIRINSPGWKPDHKVVLPYAPKGEPEKIFRKGVLEIKIAKD